MALFKNMAKLGLAKKAVDEARKPQNQEKIKKVVASAKAKQAGRTKRPKP